MSRAASRVGLHEGGVYFDLDGTPVKLLRVVGDECCWVPVEKGWNDRQRTLTNYFLKRFRPEPPAEDGHESERPGDIDANGKRFRVGERVPAAGIYRAVHGDDTVDDVILLAERVFPYCAECGIEVRYVFTDPIPARVQFRDVHVSTCEIAHPQRPPSKRAA